MSMKPENKFIKSVHDQLSDSVYHYKTHPQFTSGEWDVFYEGQRHDLWVEYKHLVPAKRMDTAVDIWVEGSKKNLLSDKQYKWGCRRDGNIECSTRPDSRIIIGVKLEGSWYGYMTTQICGTILTGTLMRGLIPSKEIAGKIEDVVST